MQGLLCSASVMSLISVYPQVGAVRHSGLCAARLIGSPVPSPLAITVTRDPLPTSTAGSSLTPTSNKLSASVPLLYCRDVSPVLWIILEHKSFHSQCFAAASFSVSASGIHLTCPSLFFTPSSCMLLVCFFWMDPLNEKGHGVLLKEFA